MQLGMPMLIPGSAQSIADGYLSCGRENGLRATFWESTWLHYRPLRQQFPLLFEHSSQKLIRGGRNGRRAVGP
jgi:hypothetical protein